MVRQGTTWKHKIILPMETSRVKLAQITYAQGYKILFVKRTEDCEMIGRTVKLKLSQEETLKLDPDQALQLQLRGLTPGGEAFSTEVYKVDVGRALNKEVLK